VYVVRLLHSFRQYLAGSFSFLLLGPYLIFLAYLSYRTRFIAAVPLVSSSFRPSVLVSHLGSSRTTHFLCVFHCFRRDVALIFANFAQRPRNVFMTGGVLFSRRRQGRRGPADRPRPKNSLQISRSSKRPDHVLQKSRTLSFSRPGPDTLPTTWSGSGTAPHSNL
jgi:hypothetical protein